MFGLQLILFFTSSTSLQVVRSEGAEGGDGDLTTREGAVRGESDSEVELEVDSNASETSVCL